MRQLAEDQAELIRRAAAVATNFSPDFASPLAVANLQRSLRDTADRHAEQVKLNAELMIALDAARRQGARNG